MFILDSDVVTLYIHHQNQQPNLVHKIQSVPTTSLWITMITIDEILGGIYKLIADPRRDDAAKLNDCLLLRKCFLGLGAFQILPMSAKANALFSKLPAHIKRIGPSDCKIAAIASHSGYSVVTHNTKDFQRICAEMNVQYQDWTIAEK